MDIQPKAHILTQRAGTYTFILMKAPSDITCTHLHCLLPCPSSWSRGHSVLRAMLACPCNTLVLNGKGEMKKKKIADVGAGGVGCHGSCFACQTECPATRASGNIQGDILWPLPMGTLPQAPRWASLEDFHNRGCHSNPFQPHHHDQRQVTARYGGLTIFTCPTLSGTPDPFIHDKQHLLSVTSRQQVLTL